MANAHDDHVTSDVPDNSSNIVGWEDIAIVVKDTQYISNNIDAVIESSCLRQKNIMIGEGLRDGREHPINCDMKLLKYDFKMPKSVPIGSSDDSCSSASTESSVVSLSSVHDSNGTITVDSKDCSEDDNNNNSTSDSVLLQSLHMPIETKCGNRNESSELVSQNRIRNESGLPQNSKVQFSTVQVRDYDITLGDHPYCDMYPLSLDWNYTDVITTTMDDFEVNHRRQIPKKIRVFSPVVARKNLKNNKNVNNNNTMVQVRARKLSVMERMSLLIEFTGATSQQLYQLERKRQLLAQDEKLLYGLNASLSLA